MLGPALLLRAGALFGESRRNLSLGVLTMVAAKKRARGARAALVAKEEAGTPPESEGDSEAKRETVVPTPSTTGRVHPHDFVFVSVADCYSLLAQDLLQLA